MSDLQEHVVKVKGGWAIRYTIGDRTITTPAYRNREMIDAIRKLRKEIEREQRARGEL